MRKLIWIVVLELFLLAGNCPTNGNVSEHGASKKYALFVVLEDRSGSTDALRKLTPEKYLALFNAFAKKNCGQIAVRVIGNPAPEDNNFYLLDLDCPQPLQPIPRGARLSKKAHINKQNEEIKRQNANLIQANRKKIEDFVQNTIVPHVIQYKPYKGRDVTDIRGALERLENKLAEAGYQDYDSVEVLIVSDGVHDADRSKEPLRLKMDKGRLYVVGWKDMSVFQGVKPMRFESVDGFISYYKRKNH